MKKVKIYFIIFICALVLSLIDTRNISSTEANNDEEKMVKIYEISAKKLENKNIINFYETDTGRKEFAKMKLEKEREERLRLEKLEDNLRKKIVNYAVKFVGNPYVSGGTSLTTGADCSGFVQAIYRQFNIKLPRTTTDQAKSGEEVIIEEIKPGDIVSYGYGTTVTHSAIYIGNGKIVHSSTPELGVRIDKINIIPIVSIRSVI